MKNLIEAFPQNIKDAAVIGKAFEFSSKNEFVDYVKKQTSFQATECYYADQLSYGWLMQKIANQPNPKGFPSGLFILKEIIASPLLYPQFLTRR